VSAGKVEWNVIKGDFRISIDSVPGWRCVVTTGQSGSFSWKAGSRTVEVTNDSEIPLIVILPNGNYVAVGGGADFQVAILDSLTYATAAVGGEVVLHNPVTGQDFDLEKGNLLFKAGVPYGDPTLVTQPGQGQGQGTASPVTVTWTQDGGLQVSGSGGTVIIPAGGQKTYQTSDGGELSITRNSDGTVSFKADNGDFLIKPSTGQDWTIELSSGNSVQVGSDPQRGTFVARSGADNQGVVKITTPQGINPELDAGSTLTFITGQMRGPVGIGSGVLFSDGAGADNSPTTPVNSPILNPGTSLDTPRLPQPPVSVFR
ncbi:MAG TPA: hypothetical protein VHH73_05135, partial [Verrucomicrobiae bacterium]|nr:hypothetical protein [Verrucomicrobiae bacterium]